MELIERQNVCLAPIISRLEANRQNLEAVKQKSDSDFNKIAVKLEEIEKIVADIEKSADGVSYDLFNSVKAQLERLIHEIHRLKRVHRFLTAICEYITDNKSTKELTSRHVIIKTLKKKMLSWEDQIKLDIERKKTDIEEIEKRIIEKKKRCKEAEDFSFLSSIQIRKREALLQDVSSKLHRLESEKQSLLKSNNELKKSLNDGLLVAKKQEEGINETIAKQMDKFKDIEQKYSFMEAKQIEIDANQKRLTELETIILEKTEERANLLELDTNLSNQVEAMDLANDTRLLLFNDQKSELLAQEAARQKYIEETGMNLSATMEESVRLEKENQDLEIKISMIEKEYSIWKQSEKEQEGSKSIGESTVSSQSEQVKVIEQSNSVEMAPPQPSTPAVVQPVVSCSQDKPSCSSQSSNRKCFKTIQPASYELLDDPLDMIMNMKDERGSQDPLRVSKRAYKRKPNPKFAK
ncbi:centrosomal protein of 83 kDa-like [Tetranychus urticae]|uniref:centrosomal protein of 83 kDa-like n=1 Tax=Tetranychus urticae TaxID=32264 RepID=UPI000D644813|nr:centrosomal protein of 83 kDa-like [Tetranychus urticae]